MKTTRFLQSLIAVALLTGPAAADVTWNAGKNTLHLNVDGKPLSERPVRFLVQEWNRRSADDQARAPERVGVGSIVESDALESVLLSPANDPWRETPVESIITGRNTVRQELIYPRQLSVTADWSREGNGLKVSGRLRNLSDATERREIPVTFSLVIPVDGQNLQWLVDNHRTEMIEGTREYLSTVATTAGPRGAMSRYSFAAVDGDRRVAVGMPLDQPRIHRLRWDGQHRALVAEVDVTISAETLRFPNYVPFEFFLFDFESEFGFRGVTNQYYKWNADSYSLRLEQQGQWMPFTQIDTVQRPEDFRFLFHEYHPDVSVAYNTANGIESLVYCEPPVQYLHVAPGVPQTQETLQNLLEGMTNVQGSQVRGSGTWQADGTLQATWVETPWAIGARVPTNGNPLLPRTDRNPFNSFDANWLPYRELWQRRAEDAPLHWNGGRILDGVVGSTDRALHLRDGESSIARFSAPLSGTVEIRAKGTALEIHIGSQKHSVTLSNGFQKYSINAAGSTAESITLLAVDGDVYIDSIQSAGTEFPNQNFNEGRMDAEAVTGLYMDSFEGWDAKDLNFRREHFPHSIYPLTFDARTGETAQVVMIHNFELAGEARKRLHARGDLLMANTALYQWAWSAHFTDILGIETSWGEGERIVPPKIADMDYLRTMLYHKPYCYLQNLRFDMFRGQKVDDYFARCLHYGFWPSFFSFNAAEDPYWQDPSLYNADRAFYLKYMEPQGRMTAAGWEPVTLAKTTSEGLLVERWGGGPWKGEPLRAADFHMSVYNASDRLQSGEVSIDARLMARAEYLVFDALTGKSVALSARAGDSIPVRLRSLEVQPLRFVARTPAALAGMLAQERGELHRLAGKYVRHGFIDGGVQAKIERALEASTPLESEAAIADLVARVPNEYHAEIERAYGMWRTAAAALEEARANRAALVNLPRTIARGVAHRVESAGALGDGAELRLISDGRETRVPFRNGAAEFALAVDGAKSDSVTMLLASGDGSTFSPYVESSAIIVEPVEILGLPRQVVVGPPTNVQVAIRNNIHRELRGHLVYTASSLEQQPPLKLTIPAGSEQNAVLSLMAISRPPMDLNETIEIIWTPEEEANASARAELPLVILSSNASVLRTSAVSVTVDSFYFGYDWLALNDGVRDGTGLDWTEAAWASDEGMVPHWAQFDFNEPVTLSEVRIFWAVDGGKYWTSREVTVEGWRPGAAGWEVLARHSDPTPTLETKLEFPAGEFTRIRLFQPPGGGPTERPGIMWIGEVEAR